MEVSFEQKVVASDDVLFRDLDGEAVLLNLENEFYYGLDNVGCRIWQQLISSESINDAIRTLVDTEFDVEESRLRSDVSALLRELLKNGLIRFEHATLE